MGREGILNGMKTPREVQSGRGCLGCGGAGAQAGSGREEFQAAQDACSNAEEGAGGHTTYLPLAVPAFSQGNETLTLIF